MDEILVPETDEDVYLRMVVMFGDVEGAGFGGCVLGIYRVRRARGDSIKRAWTVAMSKAAGVETPDHYLDEQEKEQEKEGEKT